MIWTSFWQALALASGGLLSIGSILIVVILLSSQRGLQKAIAYFFGYSGAYLLIGALVLMVGSQLSSSRGNGLSWLSVVFHFLIGGLLLFFAQKKLRTPPEENPKPPKFLKSLDSMSVSKAAGFGAMVPFLNFKNLAIYLSAVSLLLSSKVPLVQGLLFVVAIDGVFCASVLFPILVYLVFSTQTTPFLQQTRAWLEKNNRVFSIVIMLIFGVFFFGKGTYSIF